MTVDKIYLNGLEFYGYHGVLGEETRLGQRFFADVVLTLDLRGAGLTDDLEETINYAEAYAEIKRIMEGDPAKLIETVAERIATTLLARFETLTSVTVKVTKPMPPIAGVMQGVAVEITRGR